MTDNYKTRIETVIVEVDGQTIDCLSFVSMDQAEKYKGSVRSWAAERGVCARVYSQVMEVARKDQESLAANAPLSLAM